MSGARSINVYISEEALKRLELIALETGRNVDELATYSVEEAALDYFRYRKDDRAKGRPA